MQGEWVPPLVEELRPYMPHGMAKKKKKLKEKFYTAKLYGQISFNPTLAGRCKLQDNWQHLKHPHTAGLWL